MIWFIVTVVVVYLYYYLFVIRKYDEKGNRKVKEKKAKGKVKEKEKTKTKKKEIDQAKYPSEVELFIYRYKIDLKKVNFKAMLKAIAFVCSIDIALVVTILSYIPLEMVWRLLIGAVIVFVVILISFSLLGKYFKKKGLTKNV